MALKLALKSLHIVNTSYLRRRSLSSFPGVIVISSGVIESILPHDSVSLTQQVAAEWVLRDVGDRYVSPGIVDCDVRMGNVGSCSKAAAESGVTTVAVELGVEGKEMFTDYVIISKGSDGALAKVNISHILSRTVDLDSLSSKGTPLLVSLSSMQYDSPPEEDLDDFSIYTLNTSENTPTNVAKGKPRECDTGKALGRIVPFSADYREPNPAGKQSQRKRKSIQEVFQEIQSLPADFKSVQRRVRAGSEQFPASHSHNELSPAEDIEANRHIARYSLSREAISLAKCVSVLSQYRNLQILFSPISSVSVIPQPSPPNVVYQTAVPYIALSHPESTKPDDPVYKTVPPIRDSTSQSATIHALLNSDLFFSVTSYHQDQRLSDKFMKSYEAASDGIMSIGKSLTAVWGKLRKYATNSDRCICLLFRYMSTNPAKWLQISSKKGRIAVGFDADLIVWDPFSPSPPVLKSPLDVYTEVYGEVGSVYLRGEVAGRGRGLRVKEELS